LKIIFIFNVLTNMKVFIHDELQSLYSNDLFTFKYSIHMVNDFISKQQKILNWKQQNFKKISKPHNEKFKNSYFVSSKPTHFGSFHTMQIDFTENILCILYRSLQPDS
jgi:hypothetical protein